ncbi:hypothetical protein EDM80_11450 [bacterium]|nr:MAG: hypothetical protein EDM80_11450 [bacterium]RIK61680.1 MAG: hypothetical protein DCC64_12745 [Planctomycetota bacterium]
MEELFAFFGCGCGVGGREGFQRGFYGGLVDACCRGCVEFCFGFVDFVGEFCLLAFELREAFGD